MYILHVCIHIYQKLLDMELCSNTLLMQDFLTRMRLGSDICCAVFGKGYGGKVGLSMLAVDVRCYAQVKNFKNFVTTNLIQNITENQLNNSNGDKPLLATKQQTTLHVFIKL